MLAALLPSPRVSLLATAVVVGAVGLATSRGAFAEQPGKLKPDVERGEGLWLENCWQCHGKRALGDGPLAQAGPVAAPPLAGRVPEEREPWITTIHRGKETMPAFGPVFDRHDARRVLVWLDALDPETGGGPSIAKEKADKDRKKAEDRATKKAEDKAKAAKQEKAAEEVDDADAEPFKSGVQPKSL